MVPAKTIKHSLKDYPTAVLQRKANKIRKRTFSGLPPPMRTRAAARRAAQADASASNDPPPADDALAAMYDCDDDLADEPDADPYYYHRLAALDVVDSDDFPLFKSMRRGEDYMGMENIVQFRINTDDMGIRSLSTI